MLLFCKIFFSINFTGHFNLGHSLSALTLSLLLTNLKYHDGRLSVLRDLFLISLAGQRDTLPSPFYLKAPYFFLSLCAVPWLTCSPSPFLASIICLLLSVFSFIFYCRPQFLSLRLTLISCSVKINFNIHEQSSPLLSFLLSLYLCCHIRGLLPKFKFQWLY